jgi:hypothetical protein
VGDQATAIGVGSTSAVTTFDGEHDALAERHTVLELCRAREVGVAAHGISRAVALAEAKLGHHASAATRLEAVIANQVKLGISGLHLGASYEARARVAIAAADPAAIETYARLTAGEYRHGRNSPLGARYEPAPADSTDTPTVVEN